MLSKSQGSFSGLGVHQDFDMPAQIYWLIQGLLCTSTTKGQPQVMLIKAFEGGASAIGTGLVWVMHDLVAR